MHAHTAKIDEIKKKVSYSPKDDFRPASPKSGSLDTPLYLYFSLLFSYIFILLISQREKKGGVARAGLKDSCDTFFPKCVYERKHVWDPMHHVLTLAELIRTRVPGPNRSERTAQATRSARWQASRNQHVRWWATSRSAQATAASRATCAHPPSRSAWSRIAARPVLLLAL